VTLALSGCTAGTGPAPSPSPTPATTSPTPTPSPTPPPEPFRVAAPEGAAVVLDTADPVAAALAASRAVFVAAPVVVLVAADDEAAQLTAASAAVGLGAPLLLVVPPAASDPVASTPAAVDPAAAGDAAASADSAVSDGEAATRDTVAPQGPPIDSATDLRAELVRLGTEAVLVVGDAVAPGGVAAVRVAAGADGAVLAAATGAAFGPGQDVAAGGGVAAVGALVRPGTAVLRVAPAAPATVPSASVDPPTASSEPPVPPAPATSADSATPASSPAASPAPTGTVTLPEPLITSSGTGPSAGATRRPALPPTVPESVPAATVALTGAGGDTLAAVATLRAAGVPLVDVPTGDPRATPDAIQALAATPPAHVVALGAAFGAPDLLAERVAAAATGTQLPGGGQLLFPQMPGQPGKRYVALYGSPGMPSLGVLGEQDVPGTIARAQQHADPYRALTGDTVVPGVEIIATIASAGPGPDGNYSAERPVAELQPLVDAAGQAGMTVVLDLQPGRTDFLTQAKQYEDLLKLPYVGLALDPEWRLEPDQVHLRQIGHVGIDEVNAVAGWLAALVRDHHLPQKMFVLHQFQLRMIDGRERLDTSHDELAVVIHVDGQGAQGAKFGTWNAIRQGAPANVHWGWKNFYDEDTPAMLDPASTYAISPTPDLVTYQ
jgi:hypothetical protein